MADGGEPLRWRSDASGRPVEAGVLLRGARRPRVPGDGDLAELDAAVADIPRRAAARARRWMRLASAAAAGVTLAALGTGVWAWRGHRAAVAPRPTLVAMRGTPASAVRTELPDDAWPEPAAEIAPTPAPAPRAVRRTVAHPPRRERPARPHAETPTPVDTLARETALIDAARERLGSAPAQALAALETHRREFPNGQLAAEREFLAVESLRRLGRADDARARAAALAARFPASSYAARAERLLR
jgi:hypothetical protein